MPQVRNTQFPQSWRQDFQIRHEANFAWSRAVSTHLALPGLFLYSPASLVVAESGAPGVRYHNFAWYVTTITHLSVNSTSGSGDVDLKTEENFLPSWFEFSGDGYLTAGGLVPDFSFCGGCWIKNDPNVTGAKGIASSGSMSTSNLAWEIYQSSTGFIIFNISFTGTTLDDQALWTPDTRWTSGEWMHLCWRYYTESNVEFTDIFVNGEKVASSVDVGAGRLAINNIFNFGQATPSGVGEVTFNNGRMAHIFC
ncbi:MAG: hypothetical protein D6706_16395, partial [Chloroflexi bacterium]